MWPRYTTYRFLGAVGKTGTTWDVVLIQEGWSANGIYYPLDVLTEAIPIFEKVQASAYEFDGKLYDHLPDAIRDRFGDSVVKNIVGWFTEIKPDRIPGSDKQGLLARFHIAENAQWFRQLLSDAWEHDLKNFLGFSIDARGDMNPGIREGREGNIATRIQEVDEVTVVSHPAAGGALKRLVASATANHKRRTGTMRFLEALLELLRRLDPTQLEGKDPSRLTESDVTSMVRKIAEEMDETEFSAAHTKAKLTELLDMVEAGKRKKAVEILEDLLGAGKKVDDDEDEEEEEKKKKAEEAKKKKAEEEEAKKKKDYGYLKESQQMLESLQTVKREAEDALGELKKERDRNACRTLLTQRLQESKFPGPIKNKIAVHFDGKIFTVGELDDFMKAEEGCWAAMQESGQVVGLGRSGLELGADQNDRVKAAMLGLFTGQSEKVEGKDETVPPFISLKEAFRHITGDQGEIKAEDVMWESFWYMPAWLKEKSAWGGGADSRPFRAFNSMRESLNTTSFGEILGDSITRKMIKDYAESDLQIWRQIVSDVTPINDFRTNRRMRMGGYGVLPVVAEQGTYTELVSPGDEEVTYSIAKRGGLESLTMEMIANDDIQALRQIPKRLAGAAIQTLYRHIFDRFVANADAIASALRGNLGSNALDSAYLTAARTAMKDQAAYGDTYKILGSVNEPKILMIPNELEDLGLQLTTAKSYVNPLGILATGGSPDVEVASSNPNPHSTYGLGYLTISYWTDATDWWLVADPKKMPTIEVGFFQNRQQPELFIADQVNMGAMFTADKLYYKIRFIFGSVTLDWRSFYGAVV